MTKKSLLSVLVFLTLLVISTCVLASNNLGGELKNSWDETKNIVKNIGNNVGNVVSNVTHMDGTNANNSGFNAGMDNNRSTNGTAGVTTTRDTNADYNATRTAATNAGNGISNVAMTWIILAITAAIIVALIWYYGTQNNNETRVRDNNNH